MAPFDLLGAATHALRPAINGQTDLHRAGGMSATDRAAPLAVPSREGPYSRQMRSEVQWTRIVGGVENSQSPEGSLLVELTGKVALVTGGAVRLGKALAMALAAEGVRLAIHYNSSAAPAAETVAEIRELGIEAVAVQANLSEPGQAPRLLARAAENLGQVDILLNSAAVFVPAGIEETTEALWNQHFDLNLRAPFFLSRAFAAHVGEMREGRIVNIADWRGARPDTRYLAYSLSKAGVLAMTKALALALAPNILVNAIAPGAILPPPGRDQEYLEGLAGQIPIRRIGSPADVEKALAYLLTADFVTGETIFVTGGEQLA